MSLSLEVQFGIIKEGIAALSIMIDDIEELWLHRPPEPTSSYIRGSGDISELLARICREAGVATSILFCDGPRRQKETLKGEKARLERDKLVRKVCADLDITELRNRDVRNRIEHIDDWLTKLHLEHPNAAWSKDIGISHRNAVTSDGMLLHCRTYIFGEEKLLHLGAELDIRKVHSEALAILNAFGFEKTAKPAVELSPA